ncbi:MAG: ATP-dependent DNA helicase RecG [Ramlibacter sp.]|nr:ATP-dependent DNA helicase RecG [Ramlibacter sp.]
MPLPQALSAPQRALLKLGLGRDIDLALHLPLRYEDETRIVMLRDCREGDVVQIEGTVTACEIAYRPRRQLVVTVDDDSDTCVLRFFSFYPSQQKALAVGTRIRARGEIRGGLLGFQMVHPTCRPAGVELPQSLTPVYPSSASLPQAYLRKAVLGGLGRADLGSTVAPGFEQEFGLAAGWDLRRALSFLHQPTPDTSLAALEDRSHPAWQRLKAEELLAQQLSQLQSKRERAALRSPALSPVRLKPQGDAAASMPLLLHEQLLAALPFQLTSAQRRVSEEIARDLATTVPMHRLLQGDVGSGKTIVAALGAAIAIDAGWQCALMAPTEILAQQHFGKLIGWLEPLLAPRGQRIAWLTGSQKKKERAEMLRLVASGEAALVIGTHAVIQDQVQFRNLALAIIDEQHRFGVEQRLALRGKMTREAEPSPRRGRAGEGASTSTASAVCAQREPHLLMMSATPIPRTLAMSYYADLDVSTIDELPPGRTPVVTKLVAESRRDEVIERIRGQLEQGRQVYWVCPLIEESEALDLTNATAPHEALAAALPGLVIGLLHSRMASAEKKAVMSLFTGGQMGVLVSTTVIEVGVDVANASLMVIEHAERFGLSQLHQLRGRVGRGAAASACVLLYSTGDATRLGQTARARLKAMVETSDGFEIARRDLEIRGPGEFMGSRQSGASLLRFADLATDTELLEAARRLAPQLLDQHPALADKHVTRWLGGRQDYLKA